MVPFKVVLYTMAILTSLACTILLLRDYARRQLRLLLWPALCFVCLTLNNVLLFVDLVVLPATDLRVVRVSTSLIGMMFLLYGFICDAD